MWDGGEGLWEGDVWNMRVWDGRRAGGRPGGKSNLQVQ